MLAGQDLRRRHQGALPAALGGEPNAPGGHHGLAAAHIALTQAVHGPIPRHVGGGIGQRPALGARQRKGQLGVEGGKVHRLTGGACHVLPPGTQTGEAAAEEEQLLEHQPPPGHV